MKRYALVARLMTFGLVLVAFFIVPEAQIKAAKVGYSLPERTNFNISLRDVIVDFNDQTRPPRKVQKVILDAGHGGKDTGCSGKNSKEKDIALDITLRLGQMIKNNFDDVEVIYTRDRDEFIPLHERANIANRSDADLFISIHCNTTAKRNSAVGTETFVMGLHRAEDNLRVAKRENAAIAHEQNIEENYGGYDPDSDEGHITLSMYQNAYLEQSIAFANFIEEEFQSHGERVSRGVKQAGFLVLRNTVMPSVLIEAGFLNNNKEEAFLRSESGKGKIASSIFNAFSKYKYDMDHMVALHGEQENKIEAIPANYSETIDADASSRPAPSADRSEVVAQNEDASINYVERAKREMARMKGKKYQKEPSKSQAAAVVQAQTPDPNPKPKAKVAATSEQISADEVEQSTPETAPDRAKSEVTSTLQPRKKKLAYVVQLSASQKKLRSGGGKWDVVQKEVLIRFENNLYKYQVGELASYDEALAKKEKLRSIGFKDCFIVAYYDDAQIAIKDAIRLAD